MNLHSIPLFKALTRHMTWLNQRQQVLAENIANATTPGYRPRDLQPLSFAALLGQRQTTRLEVTHQNHIGPAGGGARSAQRSAGDAAQATPSGNSVVLETELMKIAQTRMNHEITAGLYRKHLDMFRMVLARR